MRVRLARPLEQILAWNDKQLLVREELEPALQLLGVATARLVGEVPPCDAEIARVTHALELACHPRLLVVECLLEWKRLASERDLVVVVRKRSVDWIPHENDQARVGHECGSALRRLRMEDVARARLADDGVGARARANDPKVDLVRKVPPVPRFAAPEVSVEEADLLPRRSGQRRMLAQVRIERRRPGLLGAEDKKVRQRPSRGGRSAVRPKGVSRDDTRRRRNRRYQPRPHAATLHQEGFCTRRATATPARQSAPPSSASAGGVSPSKSHPSKIAIGVTR